MDANEHRLIRIHAVMKLTGLARSTIYHLMKDNEFPKPIKIGDRAVAWLLEEIEAWIDHKIKAANSFKGVDYDDE